MSVAVARAVLVLLLAVCLCLGEAWLGEALSALPFVSLGLLVFTTAYVRVGWIAWVVLCLATAHAVVYAGDLALHLLALGVPLALLLPVRTALFGREWALLATLAALYGIVVPLWTEALSGWVPGRGPVGAPLGASLWLLPVLMAAALFACAACVRIPPFAALVERDS